MSKILLNGENCSVDSCNLKELVTELGFEGKRIAIELNLEIVPRSEYENVLLQQGDRVEIVQAIGGG